MEVIVDALLSDRLGDLAGCVGLSFDGGASLDAEDTKLADGEIIDSFQRILRESSTGGFVHATSFVVTGGKAPPDFDPDKLPATRWTGDWWGKAARSGLLKIESHGWDHQRISGPDNVDSFEEIGDYATANFQIRQATDRIDAALGGGYCRLFAYPNGESSNYLVQEYFPRHYSEHHVKAAFLTRPEPVSSGNSRWMLPRFVCGRDWQDPEELASLLQDGHSMIRPRPVAEQPKPAPVIDPAEPGYEAAWDRKSADDLTALAAVDGSGSEETIRLTGQFAASQVRLALDLKPSDSVFELGCGVGRIGREIAPFCRQWTGADISANMLGVARQRLSEFPAIELHHLKRTALTQILDEQFEKAYSVAVFCHLDKEDAFLYLQELARILKPGGQVYFETWNLAHPVGWKRWEYEVRHWAHSRQTGRKDVARNQFSTPDEVRLMTRHAGFEIAACYCDSAWIQTVGIKPDRPIDTRRARSYQKKNADKIANNEEWTTLFSKQLDVVYGTIRTR